MPGRVENVGYDIAGTTLSGLLARPEAGVRPRGLLLAIHGGGSRAAYWHRDAAPDGSLLLLGAALGWTVLAIDRPGYGASAGLDRARQGLDAQADALFALVEGLTTGALDATPDPGQAPIPDGDPDPSAAAGPAEPARPPVFVVAHSMGAVLALRMGADKRGRDLLGLAVAGVPLRYTPARLAEFAAVPTDGDFVPSTGGAAPDAFFGPPGSYDPALLTRAGRVVAPVPMAEFVDVRESPKTLPDVLARVTPAVHWTVAEFERSHPSGPEVPSLARESLRRARTVETHIQRGVGHNISLHHAARAYHLRVLTFAEECLLAVAGSTAP
ncbi:thioesterase [Embleya hyalina]|uniref:Thioesterase n=2 Tax=Embleya hyalina TaxID=516124 RepID=A0A401YS66_9ACTN|nr:thioesterase [Embleya hyalina]